MSAAFFHIMMTPAVIRFDFPQGWLEWLLYGGGFAVALVVIVYFYILDTRFLSWFWRTWLAGLRLAVLAALIVIALNPHDRTTKTLIQRSRVILLVDTSLSMNDRKELPESTSSPSDSNTDPETRAQAVTEYLANSPFIEQLRIIHDVSIYTFDSELEGPLHVFHDPNSELTPDDNNTEDDVSSEESGDSPSGVASGAGPGVKKKLNWEELLRPRGFDTRLGESLRALIQKESGSTLAGIVVFSDGGSNAGVDPAAAHDVAMKLNVPLVMVGIGSISEPVNLQVASIQVPSDVSKDDPYELSALIQGRGIAGSGVRVELLKRSLGQGEQEQPKIVATQEVVMPEDGFPLEVKFDRPPEEEGSVEYTVRAVSNSRIAEFREDDNEKRKKVNVIDRNTGVLLITGGPMRDYRFLRNMLYRHRRFDIDVWLQTVDANFANRVSQESDDLLIEFPENFPTRPKAEEFLSVPGKATQYDVVVAFDPDWRLFSQEHMQALSEWVSKHAGGLILVAGDVNTSDLAGAEEEYYRTIHQLYPVYLDQLLLSRQLDSKSDKAWPVEMTPDGQDAGFLQLTDDPALAEVIWSDEFAGVYRCYPTGGSKPAAIVYAHFSDPLSSDGESRPVLLASQFYGAGRTLYIGSPEIWRLRSLDEDYFDRFWTKAIREVGQGRLNRRTDHGMWLLERNQAVLGQTVRVRASLMDSRNNPLAVESVELRVFDPKDKPIFPTRLLLPDQNRPGHYVGDFRATLQGTYRIEISNPGTEPLEDMSESVEVVLPNLESDNPQQDVQLLTQLSRDTGGGYLPFDEARENIAAMLPDRSNPITLDQRLRTLWDLDMVLYLLVGLLSLEWLTRKFLKLS
jgi:hypothetical protein